MSVTDLLPFRPRRRGLSGMQRAALGGAIALIAAPTIRIVATNLRRRMAERPPQQEKDSTTDKTLKDTFPASDPPASNYYDIPANRQ